MSQLEVQKTEKVKNNITGAATAVANPLTAVITGVGVILGGILSKSDLQSRVTQSRFAYTTYEGILHQIKAILRSGNFHTDTKIVLINELCLIDSIVTDCCPSVDNLFKKYDSKYSANFDQKNSTDGLATDLFKSAQICFKKYDSKYKKNELATQQIPANFKQKYNTIK